MSLRELTLPQDLEELASMLMDSFQYPENPEWSVQDDERESFIDDFNNIARLWWMIRIGQFFIPAMRDLLIGFVWEEDNRIAGVVLLQRRGSSSNWVVGTVATRPEYRRRGIARRLVETSIDLIRKKSGDIAILDVIDANLPAYKLYESLGFEHFSGNMDLEFKSEGSHLASEIPPDYLVEKSSIFDWKPRFELINRILPENIQTYEPAVESRFRQPGYMRAVLPILARAQKIQYNMLLIRRRMDGQMVGYLRFDARTGGKGRHSLSLRLDPAHADIAPALLGYGINHLAGTDPNLLIEMGLPTWQEHIAEAAYNLGFTKRLLYHRMGLVL